MVRDGRLFPRWAGLTPTLNTRPEASHNGKLRGQRRVIGRTARPCAPTLPKSSRTPSRFSLITLRVGAAYLYSLAASFAPGLFPAGLKQPGGLIPVDYEAAAVVTVLVLLGQVLVLQARERTGRAISTLLKLAPKTA